MAEKKKKYDSFIDSLIARFQKPKLENKVSFFRLLAITQKAGLGIRDSLMTILKSEQHPGMQLILKDLVEQVSQGINLASALEENNHFFSSEEIELVRSSETMGNMPEVLQSVADELENYQRLVGRIRNAMTYPAVILLFAAAAVVVLLVKVMPTIVGLFPSQESLPGITKFMLGASAFMQENWYVVILVPIIIYLAYKISYQKNIRFKMLMDGIYLKLKIVGHLMRLFNLYRFSKLLGDFYNAGVSPVVALEQMSTILNNYHYQKKCMDVKKDLELGMSFTESLEGSELFDLVLIQIIGVGEEAGNIGEVLEKMADYYREQLDRSIEGLMKMIEPLLMGVIAIIVGVIVASIFLPLADLVGNIGA